MENLKYFVDLTNDFLLAYDKKTEFFVRFVPKTGEWESVNVSFLSFMHDYNFKEISTEDASKITNGILPNKIFKQYLEMIKRNSGN